DDGGPGGFGSGVGPGGFGPGGFGGGASYRVVDVTDPKKPTSWLVVLPIPGEPGAVNLGTTWVSFSPDGRYVLALGQEGLGVFDTAGKLVLEQTASVQPNRFLGGGGLGGGSPYTATIFTPDSGVLLIQETTYLGLFARSNTRLIE